MYYIWTINLGLGFLEPTSKETPNHLSTSHYQDSKMPSWGLRWAYSRCEVGLQCICFVSPSYKLARDPGVTSGKEMPKRSVI